MGVGSIGLSALTAILVAAGFLSSPPPANAYTQVLWTWIDVAGFRPQIAFYLDALSLVMVLVVTFVGFLIHLYSTEFMMTTRLQPILRLHEPLRRLDAHSVAGQ